MVLQCQLVVDDDSKVNDGWLALQCGWAKSNWIGIHLGKLLPCTHLDELGFVGIQLPPIRCHPYLDPSLCITCRTHAFIPSKLVYCNNLLAGISDTLIRQLQSVLHVAVWSEVRSYLRNHPWPASLAVCSTPNRLQDRSSGLHVLAHCTRRLLPIYLMEMVLYPCHTFSGGVCFVHLFTEILLCRGQIVFGWVLENSRVLRLSPHSETFFQLTWKLQIKLSSYLKNCLTHIWSEKLRYNITISTIRSILYILDYAAV